MPPYSPRSMCRFVPAFLTQGAHLGMIPSHSSFCLSVCRFRSVTWNRYSMKWSLLSRIHIRLFACAGARIEEESRTIWQ